MNPIPQIDCVFPLSAGSPERPVLRPPRLSLTPQQAADFFADFARRVATPRNVGESVSFSPSRETLPPRH